MVNCEKYKNFNSWSDWASQNPKETREDLLMAQEMIDNGYNLVFSQNDENFKRTKPYDIPFDGLSFSKDGFLVWQAGQSYPILEMWWNKAERVNGRLENRIRYATLKEVLNEGE